MSKSQSASPSAKLTCSVCGTSFFLDESNAPPFCGERCKLVDLGRWMNEEISMPHEGGPTKGEAVEHSPENEDE